MTTQRYEPGMRHSIICISCGFQIYCVPNGHNLSDEQVDEAIEWSWDAHWKSHPECEEVYDSMTESDWQEYYRSEAEYWAKKRALRNGVQLEFAT